MARVVKTKEGLTVDEETGEVLDEFSMASTDNNSRDLGSERFCIDDEAVERLVSQIVPGLIHILKVYLKKSLCSSTYSEVEEALANLWGEGGAKLFESILKRRVQFIHMDAWDSRAYEISGLTGLAIFRCLKNAGFEPDIILDRLSGAVYGAEMGADPIYRIVVELLNTLKNLRRNALVRWVSKPLKGSIDLEFASQVLRADIKSIGKISYLVTKVRGVGVQLTQSKVDISAKASEYQKVLEALDYLYRRLGTEFSKPIPAVATIVVKLPFNVNLNALAAHEDGEHQGARVKIAGEGYTILVYRSTLNIYANLGGQLDRLDTIAVDAIPTVCTYMESSGQGP